MSKTLLIIIIVFLLFLFTAFLAAQTQERRLSLDECIVSALKNNLGVAAEVISPELADAAVRRAKEKFLPGLSFSFRSSNMNSASYSWIEASEKVTTDYQDYATQFTQVIPTGGTVTISLASNKYDTNRSFLTINPRYESTLDFTFSQPLLRDFGFQVSQKEIIIAQNSRDISESQLKGYLVDTLYQVEEDYWNLVGSIEYLEVKKQSLRLAQDLLNKNKKNVDVGTLAPIEILSAEAEVASREADILQAEAAVKNREDALRTIINLSQEKAAETAGIVPTDKPISVGSEMTLEEALSLAMANRPDLAALRIDQKNKELNVSYARNQLLPALSLNASYWSPGISGNQILYQDNNPLTGIMIGVIPGTAPQAIKDAFRFKYKNWSVGLTLTFPMDTFFSRAQYHQAKLEAEQLALKLQHQEQQILFEIKNALRTVETDFKRVQAYKKARELAEKKLEAEEKKLKVGLTTNYLLLQVQRDLANARGDELRALIDYNLSLARRDKALGITLKKKNITLIEGRLPRNHSLSPEQRKN